MFGGEPGLLRLLNEALGGQAGWLLGVALVGGVALLALTRLKRADARTGWLIAVGGTFLTIAVAFSRAEGIFHPYYVAQLAPFTAALVGATVAVMLDNRFVAAAAVVAGVATEMMIIGGDAAWIAAAGVFAAVLLASDVFGRKARAYIVAAAMAVLLITPASWSAQTLGHATSGTFPAGGAATMAGGPGRRRWRTRWRQHVRRRHLVDDRRARVRRGQRRRHDRRVQPVRRRRLADHLRRRRRGDRRLLRPREPGHRRVAGRRGRAGPHPLRPHARAPTAWATTAASAPAR